MTAPPLAAAAIAQLEAEGVDAVIGTVVNPAGLTHAKTVPIRRTNTFADPGVGASPVWHVFAIDQTGIAFTDAIGVVGDQRIRIDLSALRIIGDGLAWAPGGFFEQDGTPVPACSRGTLRRVEAALAEADVKAVVGHEIEFVLVNPDGSRLPSTLWAQYGLAGVLEHEAFVRDVVAMATAAGVGIEQLHPEYGANQFEISLTPHTPVAAADQLVLTRIIIGRVARRHGLRVSLSPAAFTDGVGSGAHQHFSLATSEGPLFSGGAGVRGMTPAGESAVAGLLRGLPEAQGILCGSIVSGLRTRPGNWAGAYACWGTENREAAVRFVTAGPGNPYGGNVEVKVIDASANPYFATAAILGLALEGIRQQAELPAETTVDPAARSDQERNRAGIVRLTESQAEAIAALDNSQRLRAILGDPAVDVLVAVRRFEYEHYGDLGPQQLTEKFRMAWSV
ncbi:glutamine synthetase family protein [Mycobacterium xenopi]|uniref:Glutamine synthetase GlnA n=1 Tax=Mycobacterium xenopi TaxID=1789 RepID=A0AAD1M154_MYCXE|nr:glutamine synthetase family protein [Mycobacterium xenopi]MDA3640207.1 glutamine synthetase family protein [Mycobacterium xenopi]MDA3658480.1 glutamine synthetase family protein [Mycobacterium xenopi]MDA3662495.1 glutamine synthetase family protein [Mycobacterium xenopi]ORX19467.1 glutamine synthetase [Mycobacterium xenopi]SPX92710.1 glutamine synthetase catalytic domain-containing protein [Mycobacterium xenopi]